MLAVAFIAALPAAPVTVITRTGPLNASATGGAQYVSWTQTGTFSNVTIQANLFSTSGTASGNAYLTTQIGAGTTVAQQVAAAAVSTGNTLASGVSTTLFSGLTLGPGTYYVSVSGINLGLGGASPAVTVVGTGVTENQDGVVFITAPYPPASGFFNKGTFILFSATSTPGSPSSTVGVPALSSFAMLATALMLLASGLGLLKFYRPQD
jgi:hypothetical protein